MKTAVLLRSKMTTEMLKYDICLVLGCHADVTDI